MSGSLQTELQCNADTWSDAVADLRKSFQSLLFEKDAAPGQFYSIAPPDSGNEIWVCYEASDRVHGTAYIHWTIENKETARSIYLKFLEHGAVCLYNPISSLSKDMSQVATAIILDKQDIPKLGFWSKPKKRFLCRPVSRFSEFLESHSKGEKTFIRANGLYIALTFKWITERNPTFLTEEDPVVSTVRRNTDTSCWILEGADLKFLNALPSKISNEDWQAFVRSTGIPSNELSLENFTSALDFLSETCAGLPANHCAFICVS